MRGGFVDFFEKAFQWLAEVSQKLPSVDMNLFFIVVMAVIFGLGIVIAFTLFGSRARKLYVSARKIRKYLANVDAVDDDNVSDFTAHCFSKNTPQPLRDAWVQYLGVRFGYPSDIVSDGAVYDKFVKKNKDIRSGVFIGISLVLLALFAFWGYGVLPAAKTGVVHLAALALIGVMYLVLVILARKQNQRCFETFEAMQEDLDAKVNLQIESNFATDSSPLQELNSLVEEIIARNTAKVVDEDDEKTPIEALIEHKMQEQSEFDDEDEQENIDEIMSAQEEAREDAQEENAQDGDVESDDEQRHIDELLQEQEEGLEETADEESEETETAIESADEQVEQQEHIDELLQEQEEELEAKAQEESDETELEIESADETFVDEPQESEGQSAENPETVEPENVDEAQTSDEPDNEEVEATENVDIEENTQNEEYTESQGNNVQEEESVEEDAQEVAVEDESVEQETEEQDSDEEAAEETETDEEDAQTDEIAEEPEQDESETPQDVESEQNDKIESESEDNDENVEESKESADKAVEDNESEDEKSDDNAESDESESEEVEEEAEDVEEESEEIEEAKEDEEPEVVYVVDDEEEEENAKPAKLVKLPNLVDYMLSKNMPRQMKIQIATMLIGTYNKFKDSKEDRKIVISCLGKVMRDLQSEKQ